MNLSTKLFRHFLLCIVLTVKLPGAFAAGISPANGSRLNTVQVMFEWEDIYGADYYDLSVYPETAERTTAQKTVVHVKSVNLSVLVKEGLAFGGKYTWQFRAFKKGKPVYSSSFYHFSILASARTDSNLFLQEATGKLTKDNDLLLIDHAAMAINRQGKPVWFLPLENDSLEKQVIRDLNLSITGTITHLDAFGAYEKQLDGSLRWKGPDDGNISGSPKEDYHHQFTKLADGSFVVCGFMNRPEQLSLGKDAPRFNTIIHYNADSSIRWSWSELKSMQDDPLFKQYAAHTAGGHLNGFALTADNKRMFLSFKNLSDVFVLNINTGLFEASIKRNISAGKTEFYQQHGPFLSPSNELFIYNNNIKEGQGKEEDEQVNPSVIVFNYDALKRKFSPGWKYEVHAGKYPEGMAGKEGYVTETKNGNVLVCTGGVNYAAEITRKGEKIWECYFYKRTITDTAWKPYSNYRCRSIASLYPLYYTLQYVQSKNGQHIFRLHNAGSTAFSFTLYFTSPGNKNGIRYQSKKLSPGASQLFMVPAQWTAKKDFSCDITPSGINTLPKTYNYKAGSF